MQVRDAYDLIVIGDQLSGLMLAAGAAQAGKRVLVLQEARVAPVTGPASFTAEPLIGLKEGTPLDAFFRGLALYERLEDLFPQHDPPLQVVGKRFRLDFPRDPAAFSRCVKSEFRDFSAVERLLSGNVPEKKGSFRDAVMSVGLPVDFERFGWLQSALYGSVASPDLPYGDYKELLTLAGHGVRYLRGGRKAIEERLVQRILSSGGSLKRATRVEELVFDRGRLSGVLLSSYEGFVRSSVVVGAMGAETFLGLVPRAQRDARLQAAINGLRPRFWRPSFTLLVPDDVVPEGMGSHVALLEEEGFLQIQVFPAGAYDEIPKGKRAVVVRMQLPFESESLSDHGLIRHFRRAKARVGELMPFLREAEIYPVPESADFLPALRPGDHPAPLRVAYADSLAGDPRDYLDWSRFGLPGLALCSRDIYPLFGFVGEAFAAMDLLGRLWKKEKARS